MYKEYFESLQKNRSKRYAYFDTKLFKILYTWALFRKSREIHIMKPFFMNVKEFCITMNLPFNSGFQAFRGAFIYDDILKAKTLKSKQYNVWMIRMQASCILFLFPCGSPIFWNTFCCTFSVSIWPLSHFACGQDLKLVLWLCSLLISPIYPPASASRVELIHQPIM